MNASRSATSILASGPVSAACAARRSSGADEMARAKTASAMALTGVARSSAD